MNRWLVPFILVSGLLITGCGIFGKREDYYPLAVGNSWNYRGWVRVVNGPDVQPDTVQTSDIRVAATRKTNLSTGEEVFELVNTTTLHFRYPIETSYTVIDTSYERETGGLVLSYASIADNQPDTILVLPLVKDRTWRVDEYTISRVLGQEDVDVPAGVYKNAWKIEQVSNVGGLTSTQHVWYANQVGMAKAHFQESRGGLSYEFNLELISATVK